MRPPDKDNIEALSKNIKLQVPARFIVDFEFLSVLQSAIAGKTTVELEYKNNQQETSSRLIEPIGLVFYAFSWHLIAWCHKRKEYRDFKISRILQARNCMQPFKKKQHMELNEYLKSLPVNY